MTMAAHPPPRSAFRSFSRAALQHDHAARRRETCLPDARLHRYNEDWLIERHGHRSPAQFRPDQMYTMPLSA